MAKPKVCAVCAVVLDRNVNAFTQEESWIHVRELAGYKDHVAVPVDYDEVEVQTMCDFCFAPISTEDRMLVPATSFAMPAINSTSVGGWAACAVCSSFITADAWSELRHHALDAYLSRGPGGETADEEIVDAFLRSTYRQLRDHMIGPPRPWQAGDEEDDR